MPETGTLLTDYVLPVVVLLGLVFTIVSGSLVVMSVIAGARSASRRRKNRIEQLNWRLKSLGYIKLWTLLFAVSSIFGVIIGFIADEKWLLYGNFFIGILFLVFFSAVRQMYRILLKELKSAKAILSN